MIIKHVTIYRESGRYAGWPANYGIWSWGNEIVFGFTVGFHNKDGRFHPRDTSKPFVTMQARSHDGGSTWQTGDFPIRTPENRGFSADEHMEPHLRIENLMTGDAAPEPSTGNMDFTHPDFALICARTHLTEGARSWFYTSTDRCRSWQGPFTLPMFSQKGVAARTDYLVTGPKELMLFLTATKENGEEGRVFCARTTDGGQNFEFVSWIGPEPNGFAIMPASVRLTDSRILVAIRCAEKEHDHLRGWIDLYGSNDDGATWKLMNQPVEDNGLVGNPPTLTKLQDGRLCMTYGSRKKPYSILAKLSSDEGQTWGDEIILRDDGGSHDLGYPRTTELPDGTIVTVYYYNDRHLGEAYIAATLWKP